jgi:hypothetical protein
MRHRTYRTTALVAFAAIPAGAGAADPAQKVTGPVASYWMTAGTSTGFGMTMMGGGRPSMGSIMSMMRGGSQTSHTLDLRLGSSQAPAGVARADHLPPTGPALPLTTPQTAVAQPEETVRDQPELPEKPRGKMVIYWGCGEHAAAAPIVIDFAKLAGGQVPRFPYVPVKQQNPPSPGRYKSYGEWTTGQANKRPPASIAGANTVKGSYTPDIAFTLPPDKDYMPPLQVKAGARTGAGAVPLSWGRLPTATGYFATAMAVTGDERNPTLVMWSSSATALFGDGALTGPLSPAEVQRLIGLKAVLPPTASQCTIPAEVTKDSNFTTVSMVAYGEEANFSNPPRPADPKLPWDIRWTVKARYFSTAGLMLGMEEMQGMMGGGMGGLLGGMMGNPGD